jgi:excisionase family DNA binding protein
MHSLRNAVVCDPICRPKFPFQNYVTPNLYKWNQIYVAFGECLREYAHKAAEGGMEQIMIAAKKEQQLIGVDEAERIYGLSRWTFRRMAYDGRIASVKLGRRLLLPVSEIEKLVRASTRPALEAK